MAMPREGDRMSPAAVRKAGSAPASNTGPYTIGSKAIQADDPVFTPTLGNYERTNLIERARKSREVHKDYIAAKLAGFDERQASRRARRAPVLSFVGMGRAGKDTSAEYFCARTGLSYVGSSSSMVLPIIADSIGIPPAQAWDERHQNRQFWIDWCHAFRHDDPALLVRMSLGAGDVAVGIRGKIELHTVQKERLVDYTVWVDNPRVEDDPTTEFGIADCDFSIPNYGGVTGLYQRLDTLIRMLSTPHFGDK